MTSSKGVLARIEWDVFDALPAYLQEIHRATCYPIMDLNRLKTKSTPEQIVETFWTNKVMHECLTLNGHTRESLLRMAKEEG